jgi:glycosyltransferase involved in cell wall biosynthesis
MKVALVHDYLNEFGGAERVLLTLSEMYPDAPIYTSYYKEGSPAWKKFKNKDIRVSCIHYLPFINRLVSPLRFLAPLIWNSLDLNEFDLIISSSSWFVTRGFARKKKGAIEVCYCHTPPRWLYGYTTSISYQKYWPIKIYSAIVGHFMRIYDYYAAQKVDYFIANSKEVAARIKKFYRRESVVIYPPVALPYSIGQDSSPEKENYFLIVSRLTGSKGLETAIKACNKLGQKLKIVGAESGYYTGYKKYTKDDENIEFLGYVNDKDLTDIYRKARGFFALAVDEDFGITPVEAMSFGTPVIAYNGGGYKESVVNGKTGILFDDYSVEGLVKVIKQFNNLTIKSADCVAQAKKFSKERFFEEMNEFMKRAIFPEV